MTPTIYFDIKIRFSTLGRKEFEFLWSLLGRFPINVTFFDQKQPIRKEYQPESAESAYELFLSGPSVLLRTKAGYIGSLNTGPSGISHLRLELPTKASEAEDAIISLIDIMKEITPRVEVLFGAICSFKEYQRKHRDDLGNRVGDTHWNIFDYFPGLYSVTYIGRAASSFLGLRKPLALENGIFDRAEDGGFFINVGNKVLEDDIEGRIIEERRLAQEIGENWFFDRDSSASTIFGYGQGFKQYLAQMSDEEPNET